MIGGSVVRPSPAVTRLHFLLSDGIEDGDGGISLSTLTVSLIVKYLPYMKMVSRRVHCHLISIISSLCTVEVIIHQGNWSLEYWKVIRALLGDGAH